MKSIVKSYKERDWLDWTNCDNILEYANMNGLEFGGPVLLEGLDKRNSPLFI